MHSTTNTIIQKKNSEKKYQLLFWMLLLLIWTISFKRNGSGRVPDSVLIPAKILISADGVLKITEDVCSDSPEEDFALTYVVVTLWHSAQEVLLGGKSYNSSIEIWWLVGCIFAECKSRKVLFKRWNNLNQLQLIIQMPGEPQKAEYGCLPGFFTAWYEKLHLYKVYLFLNKKNDMKSRICTKFFFVFSCYSIKM